MFEQVAEETAPNPDALQQLERDIERRRGGSKVDLTEQDIREARKTTQEQILEALEELTDTADTAGAVGGDSRTTLRKQDGNDGGNAGDQDLISAVADLLGDGVGENQVSSDRLSSKTARSSGGSDSRTTFRSASVSPFSSIAA